MPRGKDGFQPMEMETLSSNEGVFSTRSSGRIGGARSRGFSKRAIAGLIVGSLVLGILVATLFTSEEHKLWNAGFLPGNNRDEAFRNGTHAQEFLLEAPIARRDAERVVQLGVAPPDWDTDLLRQSQESTSALLDPPVLLPDPYGWLRDDDRKNVEVLEYLYSENNYTEKRLEHLSPLANDLYQELLGYMDETSHSFPVLDRNYFYYRRTIEGQPYPQHCRAPKPEDNERSIAQYLRENLLTWDGETTSPILPGEVVYLDENELAPGHSFFSTGDLSISPSETILAFTVDTTGNELYHLRIINLESGERIFQNEDLILSEHLEWGLDDDTLFYSKPDETERTFQVYKFVPSSNSEELLFEELDVTYWVGFGITNDKRYLLVESASSESSEVYYLDLSQPVSNIALTRISKRRPKVLYTAEHYEGSWWILSNVNESDGDMQLFTVAVGKESDDEWALVEDPAVDSKSWLGQIDIENVMPFQFHIVLEGRHEGIKDIWVLTIDPDNATRVSDVTRIDFFEEPAHTVELGANFDYATSTVTINFDSMITPTQKIHIDLFHPNVEDRLVVYEKPVPGYQKELYQCQQVLVLSRDGKTQIPVSLVYRKSTWRKLKDKKESVPIHLYAYGAYGASMDDTFATTRLPLLDRGMIFAVAHVRGGGEMGRRWYTDGKLLKKHNTFDDFIDVGRYFVNERWTTSDTLSCEGRSAGGLTMGGSLNQSPELFRAAILGVPFVDLVVTMSDASIPLVSLIQSLKDSDDILHCPYYFLTLFALFIL